MSNAIQRLLCITAHPDDEAGGFGGTLRLYADRGVQTYVICLTAGTAATNRGNAKSPEELAVMRRAEFVRSRELLKISHGEVLDYPDGDLDKADFLVVVEDLVRRIRKIQPQIILTFGGEGAVTAHPDHSMSNLFATAAFHWAGRSNRFVGQLEKEGLQPHQTQKLYYATSSMFLPGRQPVSLAPATASVDIGEHLETKIKAFRSHTSQSPLFDLFEENTRKRGSKELFHLAATVSPRTLEMETDLFAGVELDS